MKDYIGYYEANFSISGSYKTTELGYFYGSTVLKTYKLSTNLIIKIFVLDFSPNIIAY